MALDVVAKKNKLNLEDSDDDSVDTSDDDEPDLEGENAKYVELDPTKIFTNKELYFYKMIDRFFKSCTKQQIEQMLSITKKTSTISLRILDWVMTRYSRKNIDYDIKNKLTGEVFDIHISYRSQLKSYKKRYFDPFRRRKKFHYKYDPNDSTKLMYTTLGQLNFFKWAISNGIIEFVEQNIQNILKEMNASNKEEKANKQKKIRKKQADHTEIESIQSKESVGELVTNASATSIATSIKSTGGTVQAGKKSVKKQKKPVTSSGINIHAEKKVVEDEVMIVLEFN
jgi:hypothetical protein